MSYPNEDFRADGKNKFGWLISAYISRRINHIFKVYSFRTGKQIFAEALAHSGNYIL